MRFSEFVDDYQFTDIKSVSIFVKDGTHGTHQDVEIGIPLLSAKDISDGRINIDDNSRNISCDDYKKIYRKVTPTKNDILITIVGTVGRTAIIPEEFPIFAFQRSVGWIRPIDSICPEYFDFVLQSKSVQQRIQKEVNASAQGGIYLEKLSSITIEIPSLKEQTKVSSFLKLINERINTQNKIIEDLKLLIKRSIDSLLHTRFPAEMFELRKLLTERKEKNTNNFPVFSVAVEDGIVNQEEHLGRSFAAKDTSNYNVVRQGNIVYTKSPTGLFPYGIIKQSLNKECVAVSPLYGVYEPKSIIIGSYLHFYFMNPVNANNYLHALVNKGAKNTMNITNQRFLDGKILFPKEIFQNIVGFLESINKKLDLNVEILKKYQRQKEYFLNNLFI